MPTLKFPDRIRFVSSLAIAVAFVLAPSGWAAGKPAAAKLPSAKESWLLAESPSFTVLGNVSAKKVTEIAETLEHFRSTLLKLKPSASPVSPVPTLFIAFANDRSFDPYKNSPDTPDVQWVGTSQTSQYGNFFAVNAYPAQGNGMAIVYGSYAGHFLRSNYPTTPLWLIEGLSELYGTFRIDGGMAEVGRPSAENLGVLRNAPLMSLREVLSTTAESPAYAPENRSIFSAHSWVLAHYLLYGAAEGQQRTADFLRRLDAGEAESVAFPAAFGVEIDKFEGRVRQYAASTGFDFQRLAVGELPPTAVTVPRTLARAEALTLLAGMPASMRHLDFAQLHLDAAIAEEPGNGDAWALAGWIAETREDAAAAGTAYRRALGSTVKRAASWVYIARWQLAGAEANAPSAMTEASVDHPKREVVAAEARQSAERALALAPEFGEAAALKGRAALVQKEYPAAIVALAEAQVRLPERSDIVFNRVVAHLGAGQLIQARALTEGRLRRIARPSLVAQAREMVAQRESAKRIEEAVAKANQAASSGDLDGAIAAFAEAEAKVETPEGKEYLRQQVTALEQSKREVSRIDAFNAAIAEINAGRVTQGKEALQALLVDCQETELCTQAREILDQIEKGPKGRR